MKRDRKAYIINISKEYSIVSQFTSFEAIEEREKVCACARVCTRVYVTVCVRTVLAVLDIILYCSDTVLHSKRVDFYHCMVFAVFCG